MFGKEIIYLLSLCILVSPEKNFNLRKLPVIVWWTDLLYPHEKSVSEISCSLGSCVTSKRRGYQNQNETTAYLFYGTDFDGQKLPLPRKNNHIWALLHEESPMNNFIFSHSAGIKLFNYTSTFSRYSDFPLTTQFIPSTAHLIDRKPISIELKNNFRKSGAAPVVYLQSHCNVASDRDRYVNELMKFIPIDSYGTCLNNKSLPTHLSSTSTYNDEELFSFLSHYKFQLAFENAICDDYVTEKLFRTLHIGVVPIYKGSSTVRDWVPSNESVVVVDDFKSPSELADYILKLDQNDDLYSKFLQYKEQGISNEFLKKHLLERTWGVNDANMLDFIQGFECFVCDKIQDIRSLSIANKNHMNCPQPHMSLTPENPIQFRDEWLQENWPESYWFAYDQAKAIELMINNKENNTSNFIKYLTKFKYHN